MEQKTPITVLIFGCLTGLFIAMGTTFKLMHWPAANIMTIIGSLSFLLFYLPLWFIHQPKKGKWMVTIYQALALLLTSLTFLFKSVHLPFGGVLFNIWIIFTLIIVLPVSIFQLFSSGKKSLQQFHVVIIYFLLASLIVGGIGSSASRMADMANSFSKNTAVITSSIQKLDIRNQKLYTAFEQIPNQTTNINYLKAQRLKRLTDSSENYLKRLRSHVIALNENVPEAVADSLSIDEMKNFLSHDIITREMWGDDDYVPRKGAFSGMELKSVIDNYRDTILNLPEGENREFIKAGINLDTEPTMYSDGESEPWVAVTFRFANMSLFLHRLENIRYEIKNAETQILNELLNNTRQNSASLASRVAVLGAKLENEKKQREIENLKNQRELTQMGLEAKNRSLDLQSKMIVWFIIGFLFCSVLIFFIIRSNFMRKQINLELKAQKQVIEEKNKEITDSIKYAQRIQKAHLPHEEYMVRNLNRLMKG